ncbi:Uncharacterized protein with a C-terminal OMP (outer membrane protein) domain [Desulfosporosinus metallidurans]|uniref:Uncharacterized protein with a C-terminal OMP (Outer membrane protein) domain n=1 Tax=Desulfosporosinus metallidurans TaxID=1888891 RepID=A0A1Q8QRJ5_9FIRM|nr:Uncharacterized protein with a C-terminal OMP (outer membrane protein) domain [Desulfosporosinus metallidurans]
MKKLFCAIVMSIFVLIGNLPAYATVTDVNIVPPLPPTAPVNVTVTAITDTTAQVSWPAVTSALQYTVYLNGQVYSGSNSPKASMTGLTPHTPYTLYVIANNSGGDSPLSTTVNFTTLSPIPTAPSAPTLTTTSTTAKLQWQPLTANYNIAQYTIYLDGQVSTTVNPQTGMQAATLNILTIGSHTVAISATNDNREGPQSQPVSFKISTVPAPLGVQIYNKSADTVWLAWQPVPGASSYNLSLNGQLIGQSYQPSYIFRNLNADTTYQISVATVMPDGEQSQSTNITVRTEPLAQAVTVTRLESKIFAYIPDLQMYIEILFAVMVALLLSNTLKFSLRR